MRKKGWERIARTVMKQHGFLKNSINHRFYCEWEHCMAVAVFEITETIKIRLDIYSYDQQTNMNFEKPDKFGYLTIQNNPNFSFDKPKEEVYDDVLNALKESIPKLIV